MSLILVLAVFGVGIWYFSKKYAEPTQTFVTKVKKVEKEIAAVVEVKEVEVTPEVVKKTRKPRTAKKITGKKKKEL
jgi:hypothetical protein